MSLQSSTGKGIRIAVIDSGVHATHPHVNGVAGAVAIGREGGTPEDILGHGTAVMAAIKEKAPDAEYFSVRIYYESLRTTMSVLAEGIRWALAQRVDIINLSLGTTNLAHRPLFQQLLSEGAETGTLIVSAYDTEGVPALPGSMPGVIGVTVDWECPRDRFRCTRDGAGLRWHASGYPRPLPGVPPRRNLHGVSFAVASMTAFAARVCEQEGMRGNSLERIEARLEEAALRPEQMQSHQHNV